MLEELVGRPVRLKVKGDNQAALALARHGGTWRPRHYAVKAVALREAVRHGWCTVEFVASSSQVADMFTKLVNIALSRRMRELAGMGPGAAAHWIST